MCTGVFAKVDKLAFKVFVNMSWKLKYLYRAYILEDSQYTEWIVCKYSLFHSLSA